MSQIEQGHIGAFRQDPNNARKHNPRNVGMIERSLQESGAGRSILADRHGTILAGNATIEAAANAGIEDAVIVRTRGDQLIVHVREDLDATDPQAIKLALADNRAAELATWDTDVLQAFAEADVLDFAFTTDELDALFKDRPKKEESTDSALDNLPALSFRIVVEVDDEDAQIALIDELEERGLRCKPVTG
jgi:hypothetical protein